MSVMMPVWGALQTSQFNYLHMLKTWHSLSLLHCTVCYIAPFCCSVGRAPIYQYLVLTRHIVHQSINISYPPGP